MCTCVSPFVTPGRVERARCYGCSLWATIAAAALLVHDSPEGGQSGTSGTAPGGLRPPHSEADAGAEQVTSEAAGKPSCECQSSQVRRVTLTPMPAVRRAGAHEWRVVSIRLAMLHHGYRLQKVAGREARERKAAAHQGPQERAIAAALAAARAAPGAAAGGAAAGGAAAGVNTKPESSPLKPRECCCGARSHGRRWHLPRFLRRSLPTTTFIRP